jgi:tRNA (guanine10-N2)-dimethyltransferase
MESIIILGRQPSIGLAELESLYGADTISVINGSAVSLKIQPGDIDFERLGGAIKLAEVLNTSDISNLKDSLIKNALQLKLPGNSKITLGLSAYGLNISSSKLQALALTIKKVLRNKGFNIRVIPNRTSILNSAQVLHNKLASQSGIELLLVANANKIIIARTTNVQNITEYTERDRNRPKRDSYVGMLPPKLAQIIINLASGNNSINNKRLLDPFCGTGVVLQEALLMGFKVYGTDIDQRMIDYSKTNIKWLASKQTKIEAEPAIEKADACSYIWQKPIDLVASETFLGKPLKSLPNPEEFTKMIHNINFLHKKFLKNIAGQLPANTRLCLAMPAWYKNGSFVSLPLLDQLGILGYNRVAFNHAGHKELIYHRPEQIVARELVTIIRK